MTVLYKQDLINKSNNLYHDGTNDKAYEISENKYTSKCPNSDFTDIFTDW